MKTIKQISQINASVEKVWEALTDPKIIDKWGGGPAKMSDKVGFEFSLWDGDIYGENIEVETNKKLVQEWFGGKWDKPSLATFALSSKNGKTTIELTQTDVPDAEFEDIEQGWKDYYLGPLKELLEKTSN